MDGGGHVLTPAARRADQQHTAATGDGRLDLSPNATDGRAIADQSLRPIARGRLLPKATHLVVQLARLTFRSKRPGLFRLGEVFFLKDRYQPDQIVRIRAQRHEFRTAIPGPSLLVGTGHRGRHGPAGHGVGRRTQAGSHTVRPGRLFGGLVSATPAEQPVGRLRKPIETRPIAEDERPLVVQHVDRPRGRVEHLGQISAGDSLSSHVTGPGRSGLWPPSCRLHWGR